MILIVFLAVNFVAAYLVFRDAAARGMKGRGWALLTLLTSMLCLPFYLVARRGAKNA